jgi:hypothetical protein
MGWPFILKGKKSNTKTNNRSNGEADNSADWRIVNGSRDCIGGGVMQ